MTELRCGTCGQLDAPEWISVKDETPTEWQDVLAICEEGIVIAQYYGEEFGGWATSMNKTTDHVTHWMPLPPAPEEIGT